MYTIVELFEIHGRGDKPAVRPSQPPMPDIEGASSVSSAGVEEEVKRHITRNSTNWIDFRHFSDVLPNYTRFTLRITRPTHEQVLFWILQCCFSLNRVGVGVIDFDAFGCLKMLPSR